MQKRIFQTLTEAIDFVERNDINKFTISRERVYTDIKQCVYTSILTLTYNEEEVQNAKNKE